MRSDPATVEDLFGAINAIWPFDLAEDWDRVGLVVGSRAASASRVLLVVDVTEQTVNQAIAGNYDVVLAHHPLLLTGVSSVDEGTSKGSLIAKLVRAGISLIAAHTNADSPNHGVAAVFAEKLHLMDVQPIEEQRNDATVGIGRVGMLKAAMTLRELAEHVSSFIPATVGGVRVAGDPQQRVQRVAVCPGAGDSLLAHPRVIGADAYITADLRHHPASESRETSAARGSGPALLDVSHFASEWVWLETAANVLSSALPLSEFSVSEIRTDVWDFSVAASASLEPSEA